MAADNHLKLCEPARLKNAHTATGEVRQRKAALVKKTSQHKSLYAAVWFITFDSTSVLEVPRLCNLKRKQ